MAEDLDGENPPITEADATKYLGKYILVGITQEDAFGNVIEYYVIPPALEPAEPGEYRLYRSGEVVTDPDYVTTFTITPPQKH